MATNATTVEGSIDCDHNQAPLWAYGEAAATRAEEASTCENGKLGCPGPVPSPQWDDETQCPDCFGESFLIMEDTDD